MFPAQGVFKYVRSLYLTRSTVNATISKVFLPRLSCNKHFIITVRQLFTFKRTKTLKPRHLKDNVPNNYLLVYENSLKHFIVPCRLISSVICATTFGFTSYYISEHFNSLQLWDKSTLIGIGLFCLLILFSVNKLSSYYITRIYHDEGTDLFIGIYHNFFGGLRQVKYSASDLSSMSLTGTSSHLRSNVTINGRTFHIRASDFVLPKYYNRHTGHI